MTVATITPLWPTKGKHPTFGGPADPRPDLTGEWWQPVRPLAVVERPAGVWWASVPANDATGTNVRLCEEQGHRVYKAIRPLHATAPGCQGNDRARAFYVCHICAPWKGK